MLYWDGYIRRSHHRNHWELQEVRDCVYAVFEEVIWDEDECVDCSMKPLDRAICRALCFENRRELVPLQQATGISKSYIMIYELVRIR